LKSKVAFWDWKKAVCDNVSTWTCLPDTNDPTTGNLSQKGSRSSN